MGINWLDAILTSVSMSIDAMSVNAANGISHKDMKIKTMILISLAFGIFQIGMPTIGYFIGYSFRDALEKWIPWIAFALLTFLGLKSFIDWLLEYKKRKKGEEEIEPKKITFWSVMVQAVATSIDALCIGFVYLNYEIPAAMIVFCVIGIVTFTLSFLSVFLAKKLAGPLEKWAGLIATVVFIGIGIKILLEGIL